MTPCTYNPCESQAEPGGCYCRAHTQSACPSCSGLTAREGDAECFGCGRAVEVPIGVPVYDMTTNRVVPNAQVPGAQIDIDWVPRANRFTPQ